LRSLRTKEFRERYESLPEEIREKARRSFGKWKANTRHPSLFLKQVDAEEDMWSVRVDRNYRALCMKTEDGGETVFVWFWIGPHDEYERLLG
jgi:plasmid maintenance system killer protein